MRGKTNILRSFIAFGLCGLIMLGCSVAGESSDLQRVPRDEEAAAVVPAADNGNYTIVNIYASDDFAFDWQSGSYETIHLNGATYTLFGGDKKIVDVTLNDMVTYLSESGVTTGPQGMETGGRSGDRQRLPQEEFPGQQPPGQY